MPTSKRILDIIASASALIVLAPIMLLIAAIIKLESKGPVMYAAPRAGMGFAKFKLLKFRTMFADADKRLKDLKHLNLYAAEEPAAAAPAICERCAQLHAPCSPILVLADGTQTCEYFYTERKKKNTSTFFKIANDPRITPFGKFLRNTSLDELPQFINVLKGDMSLVGNRPLPLYEAEQLTNDQAALRFAAPAGITGLWQVTKRGMKGEMSEEERIGLDNTYAQNVSLWNDIKLMIKTVPALLQKENV